MTMETMLASSTALFTDNLVYIGGFLVAAAGVILVVLVGKRALFWTIRKIGGLFR